VPITTRGYRVALFLKVEGFKVSDLAELPRASRHSGGYIIPLGTKHRRYFVHPTDRANFIVLETDDRETRKSAVNEVVAFLRGKQKKPERVTLDTPTALDFLKSFEKDQMFREGKVTTFYGDRGRIQVGRGFKTKVRTKIVFNTRNTDEARKLGTDQVWEIRGYAITLIKSGKKHYGHVFFDAKPVPRVVKVAAPMDDDLHEMLAERLLRRL